MRIYTIACRSIQAICLILMLPLAVMADVPTAISFQGSLSNTGGVPLDGDQLLVFSLFDAAEEGNEIWSEQQTVTVHSGVFNVRLGEVTPLAVADFANAERYLEVRVFASGTGWETLAPRQPLSAAAFSFKAVDTDSLAGHTIADLNATYVIRGETSAVTSPMIADKSITAADLADNSITAVKIAPSAVGSSEIADGSVTTADLAEHYVNVTGGIMTGSLSVGGLLYQQRPHESLWNAVRGHRRH